MDRQQISVAPLLFKAAILFLILNILFAALNPMPLIGRLSLYNRLLPGRLRLPFGEDPERAYNLSLTSLEAMFASHELDGASKPEDEFRVLAIGDSSVWGFLLENEDTLTGRLNAAGLQAADGRPVVFYNLGHPTISLAKDLLILDYAMQYEPDLILWLVTLEAFPLEKQSASPLVQNNAARVATLAQQFDLPVDATGDEFAHPDFWERTIIGQRRNLAGILRLQLYGFAWATTGIDVYIPDDYQSHAVDLEADESYGELQPPTLEPRDLAFDLLAAGIQMAGSVPLLIINEPTFVSDGANSDVRYNAFYPRWAYDAYRELMQSTAAENQWHYVDLWQAVGNDQFTNTPVHLTAAGTIQLASALELALEKQFNIQR